MDAPDSAHPNAAQPRVLEVDIRKRLPGFSLAVAFRLAGEVLVLFGPSGAGKSLTLQAIAGAQVPDEGRIALGGRVLFERAAGRRARSLPMRRRRVGFVEQDYALFPHLSVAGNVGYGMPRRPRAARAARVRDLLSQVHLGGLEGRFPHELSGGQRQRVALARALAAEPEVLLLDEPFAALDEAVRGRIQQDLRALQRALSLPVLYVTHSLRDAFVLGDRLAVIGDGALQQVGPIDEVIARPASVRVAQATGLNNILRGTVLDAGPDGLNLQWGGQRLQAPPQRRAPGEAVTFYIRPEDVKLIYPDRPLAKPVWRNLIRARVVEPPGAGPQRTLRVLPEGGDDPLEVRFSAHSYRELDLSVGAPLVLALRRDAIFIFPAPAPGRSAPPG